MTPITKFEDLIAWQEARKLVIMIYKITSNGEFSRDFGLKDQIQRAAVSSMTNIAEGFDNESTAEFARFLGMARRSAVEVQSLLYIALDVNYIQDDTFRIYHDQGRKVQAIIGGLKKSILKNPRRTDKPAANS